MSTDLPENAFIRGLNPETFQRLREHLTPADPALGAYMQTNEGRTDWVYFPESCLLSLISNDPNGMSVETSMVGNEGAAGLLEACGSGISSTDCIVQVDGKAWRAPAAACRALAMSDPDFSAAAWRFMEIQMAEARQSGLCQATHPVEQRCARWLLESYDRCGRRHPLPMTQEFLSAMLGVQRTTVSSVAAALQRKGAITYRRGRVEIVDAEMLEAQACECRKAMVRQRKRLDLTPLITAGDEPPIRR